jgi:hypothetical protein
MHSRRIIGDAYPRITRIKRMSKPLHERVMKKINLGCGSTFIISDEWLNFDYGSSSSGVRKADLLERLPLEKNSAAISRGEIHEY